MSEKAALGSGIFLSHPGKKEGRPFLPFSPEKIFFPSPGASVRIQPHPRLEEKRGGSRKEPCRKALTDWYSPLRSIRSSGPWKPVPDSTFSRCWKGGRAGLFPSLKRKSLSPLTLRRPSSREKPLLLGKGSQWSRGPMRSGVSPCANPRLSPGCGVCCTLFSFSMKIVIYGQMNFLSL